MIISTFPSKTDALKIGRKLLEERLIACVNILSSITSLYWWENSIEEEEEVILLIKTAPELEEEVMNRIKQLHPYEIPAIYCIPSTDLIFDKYMNWIKNETINLNKHKFKD
ncbi:MAG: divalent-cation tolerance protein CutA [Candidatus Hodarchaeales archaeon]|jgi:periplasmic divalent cation tolerance protein